jgi:hypothetical protein
MVLKNLIWFMPETGDSSPGLKASWPSYDAKYYIEFSDGGTEGESLRSSIPIIQRAKASNQRPGN